jgi:predicted adenylyl cyclase CyaB
MPRNFEIKAKVNDISLLEKIAIEIGARFDADFVQVDTYFDTWDGRLKMREFGNDRAELIFYRRVETSERRWSDYEVVQVCEPEKLKNLLAKIFGLKVVVEKRRKVYLYENARIHLDKVNGLGDFIEFEVMCDGDEKQVEELMEFLIERFGLKQENFIKVSYSDLLIQKQKLNPK